MILKINLSSRVSLAVLLVPSAGSILFLSSCKAELRASADWAKQEEAGNSPVTTLERTLYNVAFFADYEDPDLFEDSKGLDDGFVLPASTKSGGFGFQGGLEFIAKGAKYDLSVGGGNIGLNYLEVPVYGIYKYALNKENKIYAGLGPYLAYGVGGKVNYGGTSMSSFGENAGGYKRFDAGPSFELGYQYKVFTLTFSYDLGVLNTAYPVQDLRAYNRSFSLNLGYRFGKIFDRK